VSGIQLTPKNFQIELESDNFKQWIRFLYDKSLIDQDDNERTIQFYVASYFVNMMMPPNPRYYPKKIFIEGFDQHSGKYPDLHIKDIDGNISTWVEIKSFTKSSPNGRKNEIKKDLDSLIHAQENHSLPLYLILTKSGWDARNMIEEIAGSDKIFNEGINYIEILLG